MMMAGNVTLGSAENERSRKKLFDYAMQGRWDEAMELYKRQRWLRKEQITVDRDTALHLAVRDEMEGVVEEMVELVVVSSSSPRQDEVDVLESKNEAGNTPLHLAASIGNVSICVCLANKFKHLVGIRNNNGESPLFLAVRHGQTQAFLCLQAINSVPGFFRNHKGQTILHSAIAGGHLKLASLINERYEDLDSTVDEKGESPLHLLANQPAAFRSGTPLTTMDKVIYHCISAIPPSSDQTVAKLLPVLPRSNIKGIFFMVLTFIKICINPSSAGAKAECARTDLDEENRLTPNQGSNKENGEKVGLSPRNFPVNWDTCFNFIMLLTKAVLGILSLGVGRSYINKIQQKKEKNVCAARIVQRILKKAEGSWYDSTGRDPLYKDKTTSYKVECDQKVEMFEMDPENEQKSSNGECDQKVDMFKMDPENEQKSSNGEDKEKSSDNDEKKQVEKDPTAGMPPFLVAAMKGITEMVEEILRTHPRAVHDLDSSKKNVFLLAAEHRQVKVVQLLWEKFSHIKSAFRAVDNHGNNALHLAATYKPAYWIGVPEGLQLQMEIVVFEYVKQSVPHSFLMSSNYDNKSPEDVFADTHEELLVKSREWLRNTSNQCGTLAGLIASITFATSTSLPAADINGGSRRPSFGVQAGFTIFAVSSLIALSFSMTSAVVFLTMGNSTYNWRDFARKVPRMLFFGFSTLFISIAAALMSFCGAHIYILAYKLSYASILLYPFVFLPIILFSLAHFRLSYLALPFATFGITTEQID